MLVLSIPRLCLAEMLLMAFAAGPAVGASVEIEEVGNHEASEILAAPPLSKLRHVPFTISALEFFKKRIEGDYDRCRAEADEADDLGGCSFRCHLAMTVPKEHVRYQFYYENSASLDVTVRFAGSEDKVVKLKHIGHSTSMERYPGKGLDVYEDYFLSGSFYPANGPRQELKVVLEEGSINVCSVSVSVSETWIPNSGKNETIIEANQYQDAYERTPEKNFGGKRGCDRGDGVDLERTNDAPGYCNVKYTQWGEWLEYKLRVGYTYKGFKRFTIEARVASKKKNKYFHVEMDGQDITGPIEAPGEGWLEWRTLLVAKKLKLTGTTPDFDESKSLHTMRVVFDTGGINLNYIKITNPPKY